jgi:hypothetical protein
MATVYGTPKQLPDGRYFARASHDEGARVMIQLNKVKLLTKFDESDDVTIELNEGALAKIGGVDENNIAASKVNSQAWFGKVLADQTLEAAYSKSVSGTTMNLGKAKVTKVFDHTKTAVESSVIEAGTVGDVILEFCGIWFMKKTFGSVWRIAQVRLLAPPKKSYPDEYLFQDDETSPEPEADAEDDYI